MEFDAEAAALRDARSVLARRGQAVVVPEPLHDDGLKEGILCMRWVAGEKISVVSPLLTKRPRVFRDCVTALVDAHACLLFHGGLVHMDPHPGNVLIDVRADAAVPVLLDWGMHQRLAVWKSTSASDAPENSSLSHFSATTRPP
jgi:predicted unusual protein kinase regulating ubiquinone biosynthesis (AarF/ABC1/UbiB family)